MGLGEKYGLKIQRGASPANPDDRCNPKLAAQATGRYLKDLMTSDFPDQINAIGYPLAIAELYSGQGKLRPMLSQRRNVNQNERLSFWTLLEPEAQSPKEAPGSKLLQTETKSYVTKFFAAAIVGENPEVFGVDLPPLSKFLPQVP